LIHAYILIAPFAFLSTFNISLLKTLTTTYFEYCCLPKPTS
jgi:hypothetical protein